MKTVCAKHKQNVTSLSTIHADVIFLEVVSLEEVQSQGEAFSVKMTCQCNAFCLLLLASETDKNICYLKPHGAFIVKIVL